MFTNLFNVSINGILQQKDLHYTYEPILGGGSSINFNGTPLQGDVIVVSYYKGNNNKMYDQFGNELTVARETFTYNGTNLVFNVLQKISSIISITTNGLVEYSDEGYQLTGKDQITLTRAPVKGSTIELVYLY